MKGKKVFIGLIILLVGVIGGAIAYENFILNPTSPQKEPEEETITVVVFFNKEGIQECDRVFPIRREIKKTEQIGKKALEELLNGPTQEDQANGYLTNIPESVELNNLIIENGVATADFSEEMNNAAGSCQVQAIRAQIEQTLFQFRTVREVVISVEGEQEGILQP